ncbi:exodeoxyribonuclease III [Caldisericum exile]|uniref:Exodeoxyribonuclease III n=1 Tax=Caldisericum exile (strain DSM 21853 / NBRC 104410 / AZM16c01) TaxID=511051 RepID=A0A7U6GDR7_CALEA|nr:exodeoxyribonuclease III [Caldisericum exile]BAL80548.1 exodeoxyribonuclease III [Caldisericum exile AZM16c01]
MKIATWNVNSIRSRVEHVLMLLKDNEVDILGIQELKTEEKNFPFKDFESLGYYVEAFGQKAYNGVALISKFPFESITKNVLNDTEARTIVGIVKGLHILNVYFPHGGEYGSEKFFYKLEFYQKIKNYILKNNLLDVDFILMGDFNVAKEPIDVWDPVMLDGTIGFMKEEREAISDLMSIGLVDAFRHFNPDVQEFTWWDYTSGSFRRNWGMRIDYILVSKSMLPKLQNCYIEKTFRKLEKPSDHVPVVLEISV